MNLKPPLTFTEQVERLKRHGMIIADEENAQDVLRTVNYYRLSGYFIQFRKSPSDSDLMDGVTFEHVIRIYALDEDLRNFARKYLEKIEIYFRTQIAYYFSVGRCLSAPHDQHYSDTNFSDRDGFNEIRRSFRLQRSYYRDSLVLQHHDRLYSQKMPLWVIVEFLSFSNLSKLYHAMLPSEKDAIAREAHTGSTMLSNNLHCLSVFRNKCAHGARLYNTIFSPPARFNPSFLRTTPELRGNSFFAYFLTMLRRLPNEKLKADCADEFIRIISEYERDVDLSLLGLVGNYKEKVQAMAKP